MRFAVNIKYINMTLLINSIAYLKHPQRHDLKDLNNLNCTPRKST